MDCIQAQSVVSETLDGSPVDAAVLEAAKVHCRECEQCTQYVRALNAVRRATPPAPPVDLTDRIMAAIRAEAATQEKAELGMVAATSTTERSTSEASDELGPAVDGTADDSGTRPGRITLGSSRMDRGQLIAWGSAAAVLLVVIGVSAALGIMSLVNGTSMRTASTDAATSAAPESAYKLSTEGGTTQDPAVSSMPIAESAVAQPVYTIFDGYVYALQAGATPPRADLRVAGQTSMAFDANTPAMSREVLRGESPTIIYVTDDSQQLRPFALVQRSYQDASYSLQSADLTEFGQWPSLPPGIPRPVPEDNPDGSPVFSLDGQDTSGTPVYRRVGSDRQAGIAIAPGTPTEDAAAGNPNWTWWASPQR